MRDEKIKQAFIRASEIFIENLNKEEFKELNTFNQIQIVDKILYNLLNNIDRNVGEFILRDGTVILIDEDDYDILIKYNWSIKNKYVVNDDFKSFHRIIMDAKEGDIIDHIDRNTLNNRKPNLRFVTAQQNAQNQTKKENTSSIYLGVFKTLEGNWRAKSKQMGKQLCLGTYTSEVAAAYAYNKYTKTISDYSTLNELDHDVEYLDDLLITTKLTRKIKTTLSDIKNIILNRDNKYSNQIGVNWNSKQKRWIARITLDGKKIHLGSFINEIDAINKRLEYEEKFQIQKS